MAEWKAIVSLVAGFATAACLWYYEFPTYLFLTHVFSTLALARISASGGFAQINDERTKKPRDLRGKVAIVTGANSGIGYYTALELAKLGCKVVVSCRSKEKAEKTRANILRDNHGIAVDVVTEFANMDLCDFDSIVRFSDDFKKSKLPLHFLINNAGMLNTNLIYPETLPSAKYEFHLGVNFLGPVLLTELLLGIVKKSDGRVINVSSRAHFAVLPVTRGWERRATGSDKKTDISPSISDPSKGAWQPSTLFADLAKGKHKGDSPLAQPTLKMAFPRYGLSKLGQIYHSHYLSTVRGVPAFSLHPGVVITGFAVNLLSDFMGGIFVHLIRIVNLLVLPFVSKNGFEGAQTTLHCCFVPVPDPASMQRSAPYFVDAAHRDALLSEDGRNVDEAVKTMAWAMQELKRYTPPLN